MSSTVVVVLIGTALSLGVGHVLHRAGRPFLDDVLRDDRVSGAVARLLAVMFQLVALGTVALVATIRLDEMPWVRATLFKLGIVLLVIGFTHGFTLLGLLHIRKRRRRQALEEAMTSSATTGRLQTGQDHTT